MRIRGVGLKTCQRRWTIGKSGERGSRISVIAAQHDDDDDIYIYIVDCTETMSLKFFKLWWASYNSPGVFDVWLLIYNHIKKIIQSKYTCNLKKRKLIGPHFAIYIYIFPANSSGSHCIQWAYANIVQQGLSRGSFSSSPFSKNPHYQKNVSNRFCWEAAIYIYIYI